MHTYIYFVPLPMYTTTILKSIFKNRNIKALFKESNLIFLNVALGGLGLVAALKSLFSGGIGWDSVYDTGASIKTRSLPDNLKLQEAYDLVPTISEFYGVLIQQLADSAFGALNGAKGFLEPTSPETYLWQGGINIFLALLASCFFAYSVYVATTSIYLATLSWALLNTLPVWVGMTHVNYKDIPLAAGLTIVSSGLVILNHTSFNFFKHFFITLLIFVGTFISIATRPSSIIIVLILITLSSLIFLIFNFSSKLTLINFSSALTGFILGMIALRFSNPFAKIDFNNWILDTILLTSQFPHNMPQRFAGQNYSSLELPWWYAPIWFVAQTPLLISFYIIASLIFILFRLNSKMKKGGYYYLKSLSPFLIQGIFLPVAIIGSGAVIYDAVRHLSFVWPALIILMIITSKILLQYFKLVSHKLHILTLTTLTLVIFFNLFATARWAPYSYAFINPVAGYSKEQRNWELDYWGVTANEGVTLLREKYELDPIYVMPDGSSSVPYGGIGLSRLEDLEISSPIGLYVFIRWNHKIVPEKCDILFEIKRDRQTLGMGGVCPALNSSAN